MPRKQAMPEGYNRLWAAATVSAMGNGVRTAAIPLLAATVTRDPVAISVVTAAGLDELDQIGARLFNVSEDLGAYVDF